MSVCVCALINFLRLTSHSLFLNVSKGILLLKKTSPLRAKGHQEAYLFSWASIERGSQDVLKSLPQGTDQCGVSGGGRRRGGDTAFNVLFRRRMSRLIS